MMITTNADEQPRGIRGTEMNAEWMNSLQTELMAKILPHRRRCGLKALVARVLVRARAILRRLSI